MKYVTKSTNTEFRAIMERRRGTPAGVTLRCIKKNGQPGAERFYQFYGSEKTAQDVIERMEANNPGKRWVEA